MPDLGGLERLHGEAERSSKSQPVDARLECAYDVRMSGTRSPKKTPTNLSIRSDLVARAKAMKVNLSQLLERALETTIRELESADWLDQNAKAIDAYNTRVEARGPFSDDWRRF